MEKMQLVDKKKSPLTGTDDRLSAEEQGVLAALAGRKALEPASVPLAGRLLCRIAERKAWLCYKRGDEAPRYYTSALNRSKTGRHLREFADTRSAQVDYDVSLVTPWNQTVLDFHHAFAVAGVTGDAYHSAHATSSPRDSESGRTFGGYMLELFHRSGLGTWAFEKPSLAEQLRRFRAEGEKFELAAGISANGFFEEFRAGTIQQMRRRFEAARDQWPRGGRPYGLAFAIADRVNLGDCSFRLAGSGVWLHAEGALQCSGEVAHEPLGPFLVLMTLAESSLERGAILPIRSYATRIAAADCLVPLDSNAERFVFGHLCDIQARLRAAGVNLSIRKFVRPEVFCGQQLLPDFELRHSQFAAIVEVLGYEDRDYLTGKDRMRALVEPDAHWIPVNASRFAENSVRVREFARLDQALGPWIASIRKQNTKTLPLPH